MRCSNARHMLESGLDVQPSEHQSARLGRHLERCESCRVYRDRLKSLVSSLEQDAAGLRASATTPRLDGHLRERLCAEKLRRSDSPAQWLADRLIGRASELGARRLVAAVSLGLLLIAVLGLGSIVASPEQSQVGQATCQTGHVSSLDIAASEDGRVYASVRNHVSRTRTVTNGGVQ